MFEPRDNTLVFALASFQFSALQTTVSDRSLHIKYASTQYFVFKCDRGEKLFDLSISLMSIVVIRIFSLNLSIIVHANLLVLVYYFTQSKSIIFYDFYEQKTLL